MRVEPSKRLPAFTVVHVKVEEVTPVAGFADLLQDCRGRVVPVLVPNDLAASRDLASGTRVTARARRAARRAVFAHPDELQAD